MDVFEPLRAALSPATEIPLVKVLRRLSKPNNLEELKDGFDVAELETVREEVHATGWAAELYDRDFSLLWCSPELRALLGSEDAGELGYGKHIVQVYHSPLWAASLPNNDRVERNQKLLPYVSAHTPGGIARVKELLPRGSKNLIKGIVETPAPPVWQSSISWQQGALPAVSISCTSTVLRDDSGRIVGFLRLYSPNLRASVLAYVARGDTTMFERSLDLFEVGPRRCAVLFADLEQSVALSRSMSSGAYFNLLSRWSCVVDNAVIVGGGIVGKHVGDGVTGFFVSQHFDDDAECAAGCISSAQNIIYESSRLAQQINSETGGDVELRVNIGLHWGDTLYMGQIVTGGRLEVTALGDQVNECARIEAAASGGIVLASKNLIERLDTKQSKNLKLEPARFRYKTLSELLGVDTFGKIERDAGSVPVTELPL